MKRPRPSPFRDGLQVSPERIAQLDDTGLSELMLDLFRAQAHRCDSPQSEVRVNTEDKAKDDGCDGWTAKPVNYDEWLGDGDTCWQLKAGTSGTAARLRGEVCKPIPKVTLESGGRFVVVATGCTNGKKGETDRLTTLRAEASHAGIPTDRIEVIGSERLTVWCNQNPAIAARWAGQPAGLWRLSDWARAEIHRAPWQASDSIVAEIAKQHSALEFNTGSVRHLHLHGPPGVGKTRLALELCRTAPWSASVIYLQQAGDLRLVELIDEATEDPAVRLVVVADAVQPEQLASLHEAVARADGRIRLITVGHCPTPEPARIPALRVDPLEREMAAKVVKGWHPSMPIEHVDFVVRFADGYIRLARLAADAVARDTSLDVRGLLSRDEIRTFLDNMLGAGDRRALHVVAVLASVGWIDEVQVEGEAVARHFGLDWNDVRAKVDEFDRRFGIVPRGGRYRYLSPIPLGIHLAVEAWTTFPDLLRSLPEVLPTEGSKDAYYERLKSMASNPQARKYAQEELAFFRLNDFVDVRSVRRWSSLAASEPNRAAANILRVLEGATPEDRLRIGGRARRETVRALVRLAWRIDSFFDATMALALLAESENESWANNATEEFIQRFQIFLGGTAVPYIDRLAVIDELIAAGRIPLLRLSVKALARFGEHSAFRIEQGPVSDDLPAQEWRPSTEREHLQCVLAALERLTNLADRRIAELEGDLVSEGKSLAMMLREQPTRSVVAGLLYAIRTANPEARESLRGAIADVIYRERKYWKEMPDEEVAELVALHACFEDASLPAQIKQLVGRSQWDEEEQTDLQPLAQKLVETPGILAEAWPWLTSGEAADGWRLGEALAERDSDGRLLVTMEGAEGSGRDLRVLCGYISTNRRHLGDGWYNRWVEAQSRRSPRPLHMLFEVAWRCGATPEVARCVQQVLRSEPVASEIVGQLSFGRWGEGLQPDLLADVLRAMVDTGHEAAALALLEHRIKSIPMERDIWRDLALQLITSTNLVRSSNMTSYYWKEVAMRYVDELPGEIAAAIIREQGDQSEGSWFAKYSEAAQVLHACVERSPEDVWRSLEPWLSSKIDAYMFSVGFPRGVVARMPPDRVIAWVDADPDERASIVAKLAPKNFSSDDTLAARIIGTYGDRDDVASAFFSEYASGSWTGRASAHWEQLATGVEGVAKRTRLPKLRRWAADAAHHLREMAKRDLLREEEEELRGR